METAEVTLEVLVEVTIKDEEAVTRCFEASWQESFYSFKDRAGVLHHWASNALVNGVTDVSRLEGWADLEPGIVTMQVKSITRL